MLSSDPISFSQDNRRSLAYCARRLAARLCAVISLLFTPTIHAATYKIMPVGDSITAGYTDNPTWSVPFNFGYRGDLRNKLVAGGVAFTYVGNSAESQNGRFGNPTVIPPPNLATLGFDHPKLFRYTRQVGQARDQMGPRSPRAPQPQSVRSSWSHTPKWWIFVK